MAAGFDLARARRDTLATRDLIHLNNAGAALPPHPVVETVKDYLDFEERTGGYEAAAANADELEAVYTELAGFLGAAPEEVALADSATRAWNMALEAAVHAFSIGKGCRVLTGVAEYSSNHIALVQYARRYGFDLEVIPDDQYGQISLEALAERLASDVSLIALTHIPTNGGLINPAAKVGQIAREHGIPFLLDACQSAGQIDLDVMELNCDFLSATGRKYLRAPRGTGFLYIRRKLIEKLEPFPADMKGATLTGDAAFELRPDARRFELFEASPALRLGLGAAIRYAQSFGMGAIERRIKVLGSSLRQRLEALSGVTVYDKGLEKGGIVCFSVGELDAAQVAKTLSAQRINVSVSAQTSTWFDSSQRRLPPLVRASVHYYNTEEELDSLIRSLANLT